MASKGKQTIYCSVESCKYNEKSEHCSLENIEVAPCNHVHSGKAEEESLCRSYENSELS